MCDEQISTEDIKASIFTPTVMMNHVSVMCDTHIINTMMTHHRFHHGDEPYHVRHAVFFLADELKRPSEHPYWRETISKFLINRFLQRDL